MSDIETHDEKIRAIIDRLPVKKKKWTTADEKKKIGRRDADKKIGFRLLYESPTTNDMHWSHVRR